MEPNDRIRVFVVEDQTKILKAQLRLLESRPELQIVGTALSGEAALEQLARAAPHVVLLDLGLPGMSGIEVTRAIREAHPRIEILIFTIFDEEDKVLEAVRAGASGYLLKGATADKIVEAIAEVHAGGTVIQPNLARRLLRHFRAGEGEAQPATPAAAEPAPPAAPAPDRAGSPRPLSLRETEILQLIAKGVSNTEAAGALGVSKATIRTHLEHIYAKLEVTNRVEAVTEGIRQGLISV